MPHFETPRRRLAASVLVALVGLAVPAGAQEPRTGDLNSLRAEALELVNAARGERKLAPLALTGRLNDAAQSHAEDMLRRDYYAHASPEGETVVDRFRGRGGSRWQLVAENIATCRRCEVPPGAERIRAFQQGWMDSPPHRENILARGLSGFGFGIAGAGDRLYAVQTFAGPGQPRGLGADEQPDALDPEALAEEAVAAVNRAREREGLEPLQRSAALSTLARRLEPQEGGDRVMRRTDDLRSLLPEDSAASWRRIQVLAAGCGGCGTAPTAADVRHFVEQWLGNPQYRPQLLDPAIDRLGFALEAGGEGRKTAIAVAGETR